MKQLDYSADALSRFLEYAAEKYILKPNTAKSRQLAANKVFSVLDEVEKSDLRKVDLAAAFDRFENSAGMQYKPESLRVYRSRVNAAVTDFLEYVKNPSGFKPASMQRQARKVTRSGTDGPKQSDEKPNTDVGNGAHPTGITVPVPLRRGVTVEIQNIPVDLTAAEAKRLAAIVQAYAVESEQGETE